MSEDKPMKYLKLQINLFKWHLIPYKMPELTIREGKFTEYGFLCFTIVIARNNP